MAIRWRRWIWHWLPAILFMALMFALSSIPGGRVPRVPVSDKLMHAAMYFAFCLLIFRGLRATCNRWLYRFAPLVALAIASSYGVADELYQGTVGRTVDVGDWVADTVGAAMAAVIAMVYAEVKREPPESCDQ